MEGPTPVSSLIHSSTMVAAGYILLLKYNYLFQTSFILLILICIIGLITNLISTLLTLTTTDVKNILANSTTAQIAYMFFLFGYGYPIISLIQFIAHAFYKSLLFMGFGGLIHQVNNSQDSRIFSLTYIQNPITYTCLFIGLINFISLPGFISHYSKINLLNLTTTFSYSFQYGIWLITEYSQIINFIAGISLFKILINYSNNNRISKNKLFIKHN
jgi:NADH:ubiquinone oxidoreductase subunit 5 (subunit L)/multisubunit Na+/H+ antiporter MnhA subunit